MTDTKTKTQMKPEETGHCRAGVGSVSETSRFSGLISTSQTLDWHVSGQYLEVFSPKNWNHHDQTEKNLFPRSMSEYVALLFREKNASAFLICVQFFSRS